MITLGLYFILLFIYLIGLIFLKGKWDKIIDAKHIEINEVNTFSIVIPFRNEEGNIFDLVQSLKDIQYVKNKYEIIFVNDDSDDNGKQLLAKLIKDELNYFLIDNSNNSGKKGALSSGIELSRNNFVVSIDADCIVPENILLAFNQKLNQANYDFISGPVKYQGQDFLSSILNFELLGLVMLGATTIVNGTPTMANGANLCFRKVAYKKVNGYLGNKQIASGDDEFLLQSIHKLKESKIGFLKSREAIVLTRKPINFKAYLNQRIRWSSKWRYYKTFTQKLAPIFIFLMYSLQVLNYFQNEYWIILLYLIGIKIMVETVFMSKIMKFYKQDGLFKIVILTQLYYPFYIIFIAIISMFSTTYNWKERIVK